MADPNCHICHGDPRLTPVCSRCPPDLTEDTMRALAEAATQGEWGASGRHVVPFDRGKRASGMGFGPDFILAARETGDAALIAYAASPDRVRALAGVVEAARGIGGWGHVEAECPAYFSGRDEDCTDTCGLTALRAALAALDALEAPHG